MLQDLESRNANETPDSAEYQETSNSRVKYLSIFIGVVVLVAAGYFTYRAVGPEYFNDAITQVGNTLSGEEEKKPPPKKVSVNSALDKMMPTKVAVPKVDSTESTETNQVEQSADDLSETSSLEPGPDIPTSQNTAVADVDYSLQSPIAEQYAEQETSDDSATTSELTVNKIVEQTSEERVNELLVGVNEAVAMKQNALAINKLAEIMQLAPERHDLRKRLAVLLYTGERGDEAESALRDGMAIDPDRIDLRLMLARLLLRQNEHQQVYSVLGELEVDIEQSSEYVALKASSAQKLEYHREASTLYSRLTAYEPEQAKWWLGLAISLDKQGETRPALLAYEKAAELNQLSLSVSDFIQQRIEALGG